MRSLKGQCKMNTRKNITYKAKSVKLAALKRQFIQKCLTNQHSQADTVNT